MVFAGFFPTDKRAVQDLRERPRQAAAERRAFVFEPDSSERFGFAFAAVFLGLLHMEIIRKARARVPARPLITTGPHVVYKVYKVRRSVIDVENPAGG